MMGLRGTAEEDGHVNVINTVGLNLAKNVRKSALKAFRKETDSLQSKAKATSTRINHRSTIVTVLTASCRFDLGHAFGPERSVDMATVPRSSFPEPATQYCRGIFGIVVSAMRDEAAFCSKQLNVSI